MSVELRFMPCTEFEHAVNSFVDGEIGQADSKGLLVHLELCDACRDSIEALRRQIRVHRDAVDLDRVSKRFDKDGAFRRISARLLESNVGRVASLLYELGKAYFLAGNDSKLAAFLLKKAVAVDRTHAEGRRLVKETLDLAERAGGAPRKTKDSLSRTGRMFRGREVPRPRGKSGRIGSRSGRTALDNARRFLEECLILAPQHAQARLYLGVYFHRVDRPDEAIAEYEKVLALPGLEDGMRVIALQALGNAHGYRRDYERAIPYFEEIRRLEKVATDPQYFSPLLSLAMFYAKVGRFERSAEAFGDFVDRFPQKHADARRLLGQAEVFRTLLRSHAGFRDELTTRYPMLFAS